MRTAIISYDLKNVKDGDNSRVKAALTAFTNTHAILHGLDVFSSFPRWVNLGLPDTTVLASIANPNISAAKIATEVASVIRQEGANPDKIYVAFLSTDEDFLINE